MGSSLYVSLRFDDPVGIADELAACAAGASPEALGILFCDALVDYASVVEALQARVPFPVVGGTSPAFPVSKRGNDEIAAGLMVIAKPGLRHAIAVSAPLAEDRAEAQAQDLIERVSSLLAQAGTSLRMLIPFLPLVPGFPTGRFVEALTAQAGETPVFGGVCTGDLVAVPSAVFAEGRAYGDRMVLVALGGEIRPVFATANAITRMSDYAPTVTKAEGACVDRVDDKNFCAYMEELGLRPQDRVNGVDALMQYGPLPVEIDWKGKPDDGIAEVSCISYTMLDRGSVVFSRSIPEGARVGVGILQKEDVERSAAQCLETLLAEVAQCEREEPEYRYDTLFCVSCVARHFALVGNRDEERELLNARIPSHLTANGYYGFCEIAPSRDRTTGARINRAHSASIVMCSF